MNVRSSIFDLQPTHASRHAATQLLILHQPINTQNQQLRCSVAMSAKTLSKEVFPTLLQPSNCNRLNLETQSKIPNRKSKIPSSRAFTLTELLVVMGLIVLLITISVPAFRFLTGNRSVEGATNVLSAMLGRARADTIGLQEVDGVRLYRGVALYRDAVTQRVAGAFVESRVFKEWLAGTPTVSQIHKLNDYARNVALTQFYICLQDHVDIGTIPLTNTLYWRQLSMTAAEYSNAIANNALFLELVLDRDRILFPIGVDLRGAASWGVAPNVTRYATPAVILFNPYGDLAYKQYRLLDNSNLALQASRSTIANFLQPPVPFYASPAPLQCVSQIGVILFDSETFANQVFADQGATDNWLDANAAPVMINRYNGTLVKGE